MHAPKTASTTIQTTPQAAFEAVLGVVQNGKYDLRGVNNETRSLVFLKGMTALSWGTMYLVDIASDGSGARVNVLVGGRDDAPKALLDGWKHGKAASKLLGEVEGVATGTTSAPATPVASFAKLDDGREVPWVGPEFPVG